MYKKFRFIEQGLAGDVFYPDPKLGHQAKSVGMYLYGLPSFIGQNEVTYALVKKGIISVQPHYYGTYDSNGEYSPKSSIQTCEVTEELCDRGYLTPIGKPKYSLPSKLEVCIGHSFGTLVALRAAHCLKSLKLLVLLAPTVHYGKSNPNFGNKADGLEILQSIREAHPYTYRLSKQSDWDELMAGKDPLPNPPLSHPTLKHVIAVAGEQDNYLDLKALEENLPKIVHAYCGTKVNFKLIKISGGGHTLSYFSASRHFNLEDLFSKYL